MWVLATAQYGWHYRHDNNSLYSYIEGLAELKNAFKSCPFTSKILEQCLSPRERTQRKRTSFGGCHIRSGAVLRSGYHCHKPETTLSCSKRSSLSKLLSFQNLHLTSFFVHQNGELQDLPTCLVNCSFRCVNFQCLLQVQHGHGLRTERSPKMIS